MHVGAQKNSFYRKLGLYYCVNHEECRQATPLIRHETVRMIVVIHQLRLPFAVMVEPALLFDFSFLGKHFLALLGFLQDDVVPQDSSNSVRR